MIIEEKLLKIREDANTPIYLPHKVVNGNVYMILDFEKMSFSFSPQKPEKNNGNIKYSKIINLKNMKTAVFSFSKEFRKKYKYIVFNLKQ
ncbi:MAG: hypothetical protein QW714_02125, partial [Nanopusillaceae archaeon]